MGKIISKCGYARLSAVTLRSFSETLKVKDLPKFTSLADLVTSIRVFRQVHGHSLIPRDFIVPHQSLPPAGELEKGGEYLQLYPPQMHGFPLGLKCREIRERHRLGGGQLTSVEFEQLEASGFVFNPREHKHAALVRCIELYRDLALDGGEKELDDGVVFVRSVFVVPAAEPWPAVFWGVKLAKAVRNSTGSGAAVHLSSFKERLRASRASKAGAKELPTLQLALSRFHELNGHLLIPPRYVVPGPDSKNADEATDWPQELWGFELSKHFGRISRRFQRLMAAPGHTPDSAAALEDFEVHVEALGGFLVPRGQYFARVLTALASFQRLFCHVDVPVAYAVPSPEEPGEVPEDLGAFPVALHGYRLGRSVTMLRALARDAVVTKVLPPSFVEAVEALGFRWQVNSVAARTPLPLYPPSASTKGPKEDEDGEDEWEYNSDVARAMVQTQLQLARQRRARVALLGSHARPSPGAPPGPVGAHGAGERENYWAPEHIVAALEGYRRVFGGLGEIPLDYIVPLDPRGTHFPSHLQGMELGHIVHRYLLRYTLQQAATSARRHERLLGLRQDACDADEREAGVGMLDDTTAGGDHSVGVGSGFLGDMRSLVLFLARRDLLPRLPSPVGGVGAGAGGGVVSSPGGESVAIMELELALRLELGPEFAQSSSQDTGRGGANLRLLTAQYTLFRAALLCFRVLEGELTGISPEYVVPCGDPRWPVAVWGRPLGAELHGEAPFHYVFAGLGRRRELLVLGVTGLSPSLDQHAAAHAHSYSIDHNSTDSTAGTEPTNK